MALHVVLHRPEIPNNTGNIGRTCVAVGAALHLVHPLGFELSEKACRRAGLDYWPRLCLREYRDWGQYRSEQAGARMWLFTAGGRRPMFDADLRPSDHLVFGGEAAGLPREILDAHADRWLTLPMVSGERSLNVAAAVCAVLYEAVRQGIARGEASLDAQGRLAWGVPAGGAAR